MLSFNGGKWKMVILNLKWGHLLLFPEQFSLYWMEKGGEMPLVWKLDTSLCSVCEAEYFKLMFLKYAGIAI